MVRVRMLQTMLFVALALQTVPAAVAAGEPNEVSIAARWWHGVGDANDPNGIMLRGASAEGVTIARAGVVVWPIEIGLEFSHWTPADETLDQVGVYGLARDIGSWIASVVDYREALAALPAAVVPEFYAGGFFNVDTRFDGICYGPCVGVQTGVFFAEYRWPSSAGAMASIFDEDPMLLIGGLIKF